MSIVIAPESPAGADSQVLLRALDAHLVGLYEPRFRHILDVEALLVPEVTFVVARLDGVAVGCGAILRHGRTFVELKRMYVVPDARGHGVGAAIVAALERIAHDEGFVLARLETGSRQPDALALYDHCGYRRIGAYAGYPDNGVSVFLERSLRHAG